MRYQTFLLSRRVSRLPSYLNYMSEKYTKVCPTKRKKLPFYKHVGFITSDGTLIKKINMYARVSYKKK